MWSIDGCTIKVWEWICNFVPHITTRMIAYPCLDWSESTLVICSHAWWHHQMETFSELLALCAVNSKVPVSSPHKGQWRGALMFSFICARINDWVNIREDGDLRRHRGHYDVIVMVNNTLTVKGRNLFHHVWRSKEIHGCLGTWKIDVGLEFPPSLSPYIFSVY